MSRQIPIAEDFSAIRAALEVLEIERRCPVPRSIGDTLTDGTIGSSAAPPVKAATFRVGQIVTLTKDVVSGNMIICPAGLAGQIQEITSSIAGNLTVAARVRTSFGEVWVNTDQLKPR